jgi:CRP-like cAMP-binding protein
MPSTPIKVQAFLTNLPFFKDVPAAVIDRIATGTTELHVPRGEILFTRGDPCRGFYLVIYGQVKLSFVTKQGTEKVVEIVRPTHAFGEALMFAGKPYMVMAQTLADSMLLHVSREAVFQEIDRDPAFAKALLAGLSQRIYRLIHDVESYSLETGSQRVIGYLLRQDEDAHEIGPRKVTLPVSKALVASRLNLTPEHFSRILHDLTSAGLIRVDGRDVEILDIAKFRSYGG